MPAAISAALCAVESCDRLRMEIPGGRRAFCAGHQGRLSRLGDVMADKPLRRYSPKASPGSGTRTRDGYVRVRAAGHPAARRDGYILEHRRVLFDAIGPGEHACHWCHVPVEWGSGTLEIDHLNGVRDDNRLSNLVASCHACNSRRANEGNAPDWRPMLRSA